MLALFEYQFNMNNNTVDDAICGEHLFV